MIPSLDNLNYSDNCGKLYPNLLTILESDPHIILAVDRHVIREAVPELGLKFANAVQPLELIKERFYCRLPRLFVTDCPVHFLQSRLRLVEALGQAAVVLLVLRLIKNHMRILVHGLLHKFGDNQQLILQLIPPRG